MDCGLTMLMKGTFYSFSLHLELQSLTPLLNFCFNVPIVMLFWGVESTGWFWQLN